MNKLVFGAAAAALAIGSVSSPALAQYERSDPYGKEAPEAGYDSRYDDPGKDEGGHYADAPRDGEDEGEEYRGQTWRGSDGRMHCRRSDGTTGLIVGAGAGALIGRGIDTRGERTTGTIIGGIAGALAGRAVERGATRCR